MFKNSRVLRLGLMVAMLGTALVAPTAVFASDAPDDEVAHDAGAGTNDAPYWETYLEDLFGGDYTCTKVDSPTDPTITDVEDAVIIKAATTNYVWFDDPTTPEDELHSGTYTAPENSTSHYITCVREDDAEAPVINPDGEIEGPCADPAYYARFDNSGSTVDIKFRFSWYNRVNGAMSLNNVYKVVTAGDVFLTRQKWVSNYTWMRISYKDPITGEWKLLDRELSAKGTYPACDAQPGYQTVS